MAHNLRVVGYLSLPVLISDEVSPSVQGRTSTSNQSLQQHRQTLSLSLSSSLDNIEHLPAAGSTAFTESSSSDRHQRNSRAPSGTHLTCERSLARLTD